MSSSGTVSNPYGFQGGYKDASTGLYKYGERYYNPTYGTWRQLDPTGQSAAYIFAGDDPVNQGYPSELFSLGGLFGSAFKGCGYSAGGLLAFAGTKNCLQQQEVTALPSGATVGAACAFGAGGGAFEYLHTRETGPTGSEYDTYQGLQETY